MSQQQHGAGRQDAILRNNRVHVVPQKIRYKDIGLVLVTAVCQRVLDTQRR
jgi:hypothetical protein